MGLLGKSKSGSATLAKERLRIVIEQERSERDAPAYLPVLRRELREVVHRHIEVSPEAVLINIARVDGQEHLEMSVPLPDRAAAGAQGTQGT